MGTYSKAWVAGFTGLFTTAMETTNAFCGTWWPAIVALVGTVMVGVVPNAKKSDALK